MKDPSAPGLHETEATFAEHPTTAREATGHTHHLHTFTHTPSPSHDFTTQLTANDVDEGLKILSDGLDDLEVQRDTPDIDLDEDFDLALNEFDLNNSNDEDAQNIDRVTDMFTALDEECTYKQSATTANQLQPRLLLRARGSFTLTFPTNGIVCLTNLAHVAVPATPPQPQAPLALFKQLQVSCSVVTEPTVSRRQAPKPRKTSSKARHDSNAWTDEETGCLRQGVSLFGTQKHKWSLIKQHFQNELHGRSNVDLKDRWRNMQGRKQTRKRKGNKREQEPAQAKKRRA